LGGGRLRICRAATTAVSGVLKLPPREPRNGVRHIERILAPRSVAVVGASLDPRKRGYQAITSLLESGYEHPIYPVNPSETEILGLTTYPVLSAIGKEIDLALVVTPASAVPNVLRECAQHGVRGAIVVAGGFSESGDEGRSREEEILRIAAESGVRIIGPNTSGLFNLPRRLNLVGLRDVPTGRIGLLSQSGNVLLSLVAEARSRNSIGFSVYVGVGNEADIRYDEHLLYLGDDRETGAIVVYAEGFKDGRRFLQAARKVALVKPVVALKSGRSEVGKRSALSHTGALAGSAPIAEGALKQAGVIVVRRSDELLPVVEALERLPALQGPRIAVLADGGGHATLAADAIADERALELPDLSPVTRSRLMSLLPDVASTRNPIDVAGATDANPALFVDCVKVLLESDSVDGVLMVGLFGGYGARFAEELEVEEIQAAALLGALVERTGKPLVVQSAYAVAKPPALAALRASGVPVYESIEIAVRSMAALSERGAFLQTSEQRSDFYLKASRVELADNRRVLTEPEGRELLEQAGLPFSLGQWEFVTTAEGAQLTAERIGSPVALKIVSADLPHKSDAGGVRLSVPVEEAGTAFGELLARVRKQAPKAQINGVLVERMAKIGIELVVGSMRDPSFGPIVMAGIGGVLVEHIDEVRLRAAPLTRAEAFEMLTEFKASAVLDGVRGGVKVDRACLVELIVAVSDIACNHPEILEIDLNPVIANEDGLALVDVRVVVGEPA
jgi:acyl-CoA synthetase (NDP forming)